MQLETKAAFTLDGAGAITATAWVFADADRTGDVITKGAFGAIAGSLPMLWAHDQREVIGVWESIAETAQGLVAKGRLLVETVVKAREVYSLLKEGAVNGVSIGFAIKNFARRSAGGRTISAVDLAEISIVSVPAHAGARVTSLKSADHAAHQKEPILDDQTTTPDVSALETKLAGVADEVKNLGGIAARLDAIEKKAARPAPAAGQSDADLERKAFNVYLHTGDATELKALTVGAPSTGGILAPASFNPRIIEKITEFSPIRGVATSFTMGGPLVQFPRLVNSVTPASVTETGTRAESEPSFELIDGKPFEMAVIVPVSRVMYEDATVDLASWLENHVATQFGKLEASWFVNGNGTTQAEGVLTSSEVGTLTTAATAIGTDDLIDVFYSIPSAYAARGHWLMNRKTMSVVRKLRDGDGNLIWQQSLQAGQPGLLLGRPVLEAVDMPNPAANATPIVFGDFASAYTIIDRVGFEAEYDRLTGWKNGIINLLARRRVGGRITLGEPLVKLKLKAA
ncbi:phage major capsid protein [Hansschlegelia zhihuaiae]|uniref:Phage major capsid protein n=1 Tax=Hansschlegelia zhihuaiae TaxID=405005 RepID=A0A4Q0M7Y1_9HYPH|nr:phage major capsid protein [Hansschlegelia zhihuaiae]RXF69230.1 phage major capsid protein [Hansschlegelia zhihuaiae]